MFLDLPTSEDIHLAVLLDTLFCTGWLESLLKKMTHGIPFRCDCQRLELFYVH